MPIASPTVLVAPDSFKGTLTATAAAAAIAAGLHDVRAGWSLPVLPLADGGEGTLACVAAARPATRRRRRVVGIHRRPLTADWLLLDDGTAVIESARVLGLPLVARGGPPLARRGSGALGELLRAALDAGAPRIVVGLGGSACNDAGLGLLLALGARANDAAGRAVTPDLAGLLRTADVALDGLDPRLALTSITALCDVDNPLLGTRGAARVYGPQKGLRAGELPAVEAAMARFAAACGGTAQAALTGAGAAGGLGFALALLGARLAPGAGHLITLTGLEQRLRHARAVVTGEGRSDAQTLAGKLPAAVAAAAARAGVPAFLLSGDIDPAVRDELAGRFAGCAAVTDSAGDPARAQRRPRYWLRRAARGLAPLIAAAGRGR